MNKKTVLTFILMAVITFAAYAQQYDSEKDFQIDRDRNVRNGVMITKYLGTKNEVRIPPSIQNNPVTGIGDYAFNDNKSITSVTIPNSVIRIGSFSFWGFSGIYLTIKEPRGMVFTVVCSASRSESYTPRILLLAITTRLPEYFNRSSSLLAS